MTGMHSNRSKKWKNEYLLGLYSREDILQNDVFIPHNNPLCTVSFINEATKIQRCEATFLRSHTALASTFFCL